MTYKNFFFFILGPIILGIIVTNLAWFFEYPVTPWTLQRGLPLPFYEETTECLAGHCPPAHFWWDIYVVDLFIWSMIMLAIAQSIKFFTRRKFRK